jgi:hypothetical protein
MRFLRPSFVVRGAFVAVLLSAANLGAESLLSPAVAEIVRIEVEFFENGDPTPVNRATVYTANRRVRVEQRGADSSNPSPVFVYRGDLDRLYSIVESARSYVVLERSMVDRLGSGARLARREVDRQLQGVPADQQRLYGHLLGTAPLDPANPGDPLVVARTGEMDTAAGYPCRRATISRSGRLLASGCVADWEVVGLTPEDVEVFRSLALLARDAMSSQSPIPKELVPGQPLDLIVQLGGMPIHFERAGVVAGENSVRVVSVERIPARDSLFEIPEGFTARTGMAGLAGFASLFSRSDRTAAAGASPSRSPSAAPGPAAIDASADPSSIGMPSQTPSPASELEFEAAAVSDRRPSRPPSRWTPKPYRSISLFGDP